MCHVLSAFPLPLHAFPGKGTRGVRAVRHQAGAGAGEAPVNLRRVLAWLFFALVVCYVIRSPDHAAEFFRSAGNGVGDAVSTLASFVGSLV